MKFPGGSTLLMSIYFKDKVNLFEKAIDSVYQSSIIPDEVILIQDGPLPQELNHSIEEKQKEYQFKVYSLDKNQGLAKALNFGISKASTEWIIRADADDENIKNRFELQASCIIKNEELDQPLDLIGGSIQEVDLDGNSLAIRTPPSSHKEILQYAKNRNPFNHMTVCFRKKIALQSGGYPNIFLKEDYALWAKMLNNGARAYNLQEKLVLATTGKDMYKRRGGLKYAYAEIALQKHLYHCKIKNLFEAIVFGTVRSLIFVMPPFLRELIYINLLRKSN